MTDDLDALAREAAARRPNFEGMPHELRHLPHFAFHLANKTPINAHKYYDFAKGKAIPYTPGEKYAADPMNPATWTTYPHIMAARPHISWRDLRGPSLALTESLGLVVIDLDPPEKKVDQEVARAVQNGFVLPSNFAELRQERIDRMRATQAVIRRWAVQAGCWIETSMSGKGLHIFIFGKLPAYRYDIKAGGETFASNQFIHMTCNVTHDSAMTIPKGPAAQAALDEFITYATAHDIIHPVARPVYGIGDALPTEDHGRRLGLTDDQVVERLRKVNKQSFEAYHNRSVSDWSRSQAALIGDLDKITGDPDQVWRILFASDLLKFAGNSAKGTSRWERTEKFFARELQKARASNDPILVSRRAMEAHANTLPRVG